MAAKSNGEVKAVIDKSIEDATKNQRLRKSLSENHLKILSKPPYGLTLEDLITAHDTHPNLRPARGGPWDGDQSSRQGKARFTDRTGGKGDRDLDQASAPSDQGPPSNAGQTSGKGGRDLDQASAPSDDQGGPQNAGQTSG